MHPTTTRRGLLVAGCAVVFLGLYAARVQSPRIADAVLLLSVVPVAILAFEFGLRGGVTAALVAVVLVALWDEAAEPSIGAVGYFTRVTAFVVIGAGIGRAVDVRRRMERLLRRAQDLSPDLVATIGLDGRFERLNPAWERVLGFPCSALLHQPFLAFVHADDAEATQAAAGRAVRDGDVAGFRNRYRTSDGTHRWLEWNAHVDADAGVLYAVARDVTAQDAAERVLAAHAEVLEAAVQDRTADLDEARVDSLRRLALAAEFRDDDTHQHTTRVGVCAAAITAELGYAPDFVARLREAAPLHDVGKIGVSDAVLLKPSRLTPEELAAMQRHAGIGAEILRGSDFPVLQLAATIAETHHERWDGGGYPAGLAGFDIPVEGRIVAVADVFDALTHARPYKDAWPVARALALILAGSGTHFDPQVVTAFEHVLPRLPAA